MYRLLLLKVGRDEVVVVHGDGGRDGVDIGDGIDIIGPVNKPVADVCSRHQADHPAGVICMSPLARFGYGAPGGAGDGEVVLRSRSGFTAHHSGNQGYRNQEHANSCQVMVSPPTKYCLHISPPDFCSCPEGIPTGLLISYSIHGNRNCGTCRGISRFNFDEGHFINSASTMCSRFLLQNGIPSLMDIFRHHS